MGNTKLAELLGRRPDERLIIINCDDAGSSHAANVATYRSVIYGAATSATLMVPCAWAREAARMLEGRPVGVHLTLTSEHHGYRWRALTAGTSLRDTEGFLHRTSRAALDQIDPKDARDECRAQVQTALLWGVAEDVCQRSLDELAAEGFDRRAVPRLLRGLVEAGFLSKQPGSGRAPTIHTLHLPPLVRP